MKNFPSKSSAGVPWMKSFLISLVAFSTLVVGHGGKAIAAGPIVTWREILATPLQRDGFMETAEEFTAVIPPKAVAEEGTRLFTDVVKAVYETFESPPETHYFFCTVYYTPHERGFTAERGFNTAHGSLKKGGRTLPHSADFLHATYVEGYGRVASPKNGKPYLAYTGKYDNRILGNRNNTLIPRESIAVHRGNPLFGNGTRAWILDHELYNEFGAVRFQVGDTGGGLFKSQIDLYWGEDDPLGPGADVWRPASCDVAVRWSVPVLVWK